MKEQEIIKIGYLISKGFMRWLCVLFLIGVAFICVLTFLRLSFSIGVDDSDLSSWKRSNMKIYTDYKTGVQYVSSKYGMTVRVDKNGKPITKTDYR